jgi:hypothetical protein
MGENVIELCASVLVWLLPTFLFFATFYSDWELGIMGENLVGVPDGVVAGFFWAYFIIKRFTMLSL